MSKAHQAPGSGPLNDMIYLSPGSRQGYQVPPGLENHFFQPSELQICGCARFVVPDRLELKSKQPIKKVKRQSTKADHNRQ